MEITNAQKRALETFEDIQPMIYYLDRLIQSFHDNYFDKSESTMENDEQAQFVFVNSYDSMSAMMFAINDLAYRIRLECELMNGEDSSITRAFKRNYGKYFKEQRAQAMA